MISEHSRFGAICELESAQEVAPQNRGMAPLFASKEIRFAYILTTGKVI